jgi:hypothetical protein
MVGGGKVGVGVSTRASYIIYIYIYIYIFNYIYTKKNIYIYTRIITMYISAQELAFALSARSDNSSMDGKDGKDGLASSLGVATHHVCGLCGAERTSSYEFHRNMGMALLSCYAVSFNFMQAAITQPQPFNGQDVAPKRKRRVRVRANPRLPRDRPSPASDGLSLREREQEAFTMLEECGVSAKLLTMEQAVDIHFTSTDKKFRLALRVATAFVRLRGPKQEDMVNQLDQFYFDVTACVSALDLEDQEARDLRSVFLLAGNHRADPTRGLGEKLWAARLS